MFFFSKVPLAFTESDYGSPLIPLPKLDDLSSFITFCELPLSINLNLENDTEVNNKKIRELQLTHTLNHSISNLMDIALDILPHSFFDPSSCRLEINPTKFILLSV